MEHSGVYRREIDGLRALALVPVMIFHANPDWPSGGFACVDVFFVISGHLITSLIVRDLESGTFSLARFYERRVRRIAPALLVVLSITTALAAWCLLPADFQFYCKSLVASLLFMSNVLFWRESGYFDAAAELNHCCTRGASRSRSSSTSSSRSC
jgi:peptidoglycan/LPS O-acetylase OafA/YrhL